MVYFEAPFHNTSNRKFQELLSDSAEHVELNEAAQIEETATQLAED
jgi:hypothetical protein